MSLGTWSAGGPGRPSRVVNQVVAASAAAAVAVAFVAEFLSTPVSDVGSWVPDLVAGLAVVACGLAVHRLGGSTPAAVSLILAGATWFAGNLATADLAWSAAVFGALAHVHRGLVLAAVVLLRATRLSIATAVGGVLAACLPVFVASALGAVGWAVGALALGLLCVRTWPAGVRARGAAPVVVLCGTVASTALVSFTPDPSALSGPATWAYAAGVALAGLGTVVAAAALRARSTQVADAVVHVVLGDDSDVRQLLATALRDPQLRIAFASDGGWVDEHGTPTSRPSASPGRAVLPVVVDGVQVAALSCRQDVSTSPRTTSAIASAAGLVASNTRLQQSLRAEADRLDASRRRLLVVGDEQRRALSLRLEAGVAGPLEELRRSLAAVPTGPDPEVESARSRCLLRAEELEADLRSMASGLGGVFVGEGGLGAALGVLTEELDLEVDLRVDVAAVPTELAETVYLICSEAVTNVLRHAGATRLELVVTADPDGVDIGIRDDGRGGADPGRGTGLRGLSDRVSALGGSFAVRDAPQGGTEIRVHLPMAVHEELGAAADPV